MERVLRIHELLVRIFEYLDPKALFSCSLVCKQWTGPALERLWFELEDETPLVSLLSPLETKDFSDEFEFERLLKIDDWKIFADYAQRVRKLTVDPRKSELGESVYSDIAKMRPLVPLLPKLSSLKLISEEEDNLLRHLVFVSPTVTELLFTLPGLYRHSKDPVVSVSNVFKIIADRMPNVETLSIGSPFSRPRWEFSLIEKTLADLCSALTNLRTIRLPLYALTPCILKRLSGLPHMTMIAIGDELGEAGYEDGGEFHLGISPGAFTALTTLEFATRFEKATKLLKVGLARNLETLYVHSYRREKARTMKDLFAALSKGRGNLKELHLDSVHEQTAALREHRREVDRVTAGTLAPLQSLCGLRVLHLAYHRAFRINDEEFTNLISSWPNLETLRFCSDPVLHERPMLTASVLPRLAEACPKLTHLSLFLDTHIEFSPREVRNLNNILFASLREIGFGTSPMKREDTLNFTLYLGRLLPPTCAINKLYEVYWTVGEEYTAPSSHPQQSDHDEWDRIFFALEVQIASMEHERSRNRYLLQN